MELRGNPVSAGVAVGPALLYRPARPAAHEGACGPQGPAAEMERVRSVARQAAAELRALSASLMAGDAERAGIFEAHQDMVEDEAMLEEVAEMIEKNGWSGDWALQKAFEGYIVVLRRATDPVLRARAADMDDVCARLLRIWHGAPAQDLSALPGPVVVAAQDLLPSDTATLDREKVLAILTEAGGAASHTAIIARGYGIPAVVGIPGLLAAVRDGMTLAVDALEGVVVTDPAPAERAGFEKKRADFCERAGRERRYLHARPATADGLRVEIGLNIGTGSGEELEGAAFADFVGLFRTEFLYMEAGGLPDEQTQFEAYKKVLQAYAPRPVTLRTLDIGGDKALEGLPLPKEDNPFLGSRALRLCFARPDIFHTQLRAALRAAAHGNLWLMLPMVSSVDDIRRARAAIEKAEAELESEGTPVGGRYKVGIMVETPGIALIADLAAAEVDFASVGTNDLCQYLLAADRLNPQMAGYYQAFHPALFRLVGQVAGHFAKAGKPLGVCGEMAGDPAAAAALVGLGLRRLSMGRAAVPGVERMLAGLTAEKAREMAKKVQGLPTAAEAERYLKTQTGTA